jgi:hypothetical protein
MFNARYPLALCVAIQLIAKGIHTIVSDRLIQLVVHLANFIMRIVVAFERDIDQALAEMSECHERYWGGQVWGRTPQRPHGIVDRTCGLLVPLLEEQTVNAANTAIENSLMEVGDCGGHV